MQQWLPLTMLVLIALLVGNAPWRKGDPKHEFIFNLLVNVTR